MTPLRLYTAFHGNLDFSALPDADRPLVMARCYWPLLSLPEEFGIRIGFEMSARTLRTLHQEDPEWVKKFRYLTESGLIEPIASGLAQVVAPLAPVEVNRANLRLGNNLYREILGFVPETFFVNEQTYSDSLAELYQEAGAKRVVMEWNNPASAQAPLRALRCQPARLRCEDGSGPILLWNDSIVFQKMQRVAHGQIPESELQGLLDRLSAPVNAEALCIYGGDVEIFDYRPSRAVPAIAGEIVGVEMTRLINVFRSLAADSRFEFVLPQDVVEQDAILPDVELGSMGDPIPCKKTPRYNPTRWAVSGRDGFGMNTRCHSMLRSERAARRLSVKSTGGNRASAIVELWRSDFRTRATEEKIVEFESKVGLASERSRALLNASTPELEDGEDILLVNPSASDWIGMPVEIPLRLKAGRYFRIEVCSRRGLDLAPNNYQVEVSGRHRDGSIRDAILVIEASVPAREILGLSLSPCSMLAESRDSVLGVDVAKTESVLASFLPHRGAAIESLRFPKLFDKSLLGTIAHGYFDEIALTPDFYSGHVLAVSEKGTKETDLRSAELRRDAGASGPVRTTLRTEVTTQHGFWRKSYRLYAKASRFDVVHDLSFHDARLHSLRMGMLTLLPDGWHRDTLRYASVNGGRSAEWRAFLPGASILQSSAVSDSVSASSCLGATEGWVAIEDESQGIVIQGNRAEAAVAPMLDFQEVDGRFFCRLSHTAAESDETRATFMRGRKQFAFAIEGYRVEDRDALQRARLRHEGLVYRTEKGVGISGGL